MENKTTICFLSIKNRATEHLWNDFCRLRLLSQAYRAADDPIVARAHADWLASYLAENNEPTSSIVIPFRKMGALK